MQSTVAISSAAVHQLGDELLDDPVQNVNHVVPLISALNHSDEEVVLEAIKCLRVYFIDALHSNVTHADTSADDAASKLLTFIRAKYASYRQALLSSHQQQRPVKVHLAAMMAMMDVIRAEQVGSFSGAAFTEYASVLFTSKHVSSRVITAFIAHFTPFADVRFFLFKWLASTAAKLAHKHGQTQPLSWQAEPTEVTMLLFDVLSNIATRSEEGEEEGEVSSWCGAIEAGAISAAPLPSEGAKHRKKRKLHTAESGKGAPVAATALWASPLGQKQVYSNAWLAFLRIPLPEDIYKRVLQTLTSSVMPHLKNPVLLSDFLTHSINKGGLVGILSLHGLFLLVTQHGLEYPRFYERLYGLLTPQVFTARFRLKFLQLTDVFLASALVPAYTAAAFAKRFARIAVTAPPTAALICVAFVHNLLRRHPSCTCMLHRPTPEWEEAASEDVFDSAATDPAESRAVESSLWELSLLRAHHCSMVYARSSSTALFRLLFVAAAMISLATMASQKAS